VKQVAKFISVVLHPLLLTTYLVIVLSYYFPSMLKIRKENQMIIIGLVFVFTFVLPAVILVMLRAFGTIQSLTLQSRKERILPFVFISMFYVLFTFLFYFKLPFSANFEKLMMIVSALVVVSLLITFFYKISIHSIAMGGGIGILLPLNQVTEQMSLLWPTAFTILATGLVMSSRLLLDAHTPREVMYGSVVGFVVGFFGMIILF
jgi:membrane-associated phospholipid phosphatase